MIVGKLERVGNWVKAIDDSWRSVSHITTVELEAPMHGKDDWAILFNEGEGYLADGFETKEEAEAELLKMLPLLSPLVLMGGVMEGPKKPSSLVVPPPPGGLR